MLVVVDLSISLISLGFSRADTIVHFPFNGSIGLAREKSMSAFFKFWVGT